MQEVDIAAVQRMPGVLKVVRDGSFLGVAAEREEQAIAACEALRRNATWTLAEDLPESAKIHAWLQAQPSLDEMVSARKAAVATPIVRQLEATCTKRYTTHASLGPSCAVAELKNGLLQVWSHSQGVYPLRSALATVLKMAETAVVVRHVEGAGCYGQNGDDDAALDAALLAQALPGRPVKVQWMRDDEFAWGALRLGNGHPDARRPYRRRPDRRLVSGRTVCSGPGPGWFSASRGRRPQCHAAV